MPDMLSAYMLPKSRSSYAKIPNEDLLFLIEKAALQHKKIYIVASGADTQILLRTAKQLKEKYPTNNPLKGAILLFPRLNQGAPIPGMPPHYVEDVGKTNIPLMVLEGGRTPNRWGLNHLTQALSQGGSQVISKVIPDIRGSFFRREDPNRAEDVVTSQLSGLIKISLFYLQERLQ
jgi:hypothetical protein